MEQITVRLPDGSERQAARGTSVREFIAEKIGPGLAKAAVVARLDGEMVDLSRPLESDTRLEVLTTKSPEALEIARHDAAHVMASIVQRLYPGTQVTIGPTVEDGFYYD
ncbi:MAG TPA: threonine--tRNA ligase, partial [Myxococcales bacterium]|nr:threonine--tRNA ligase [Myxococcales bacterium]